MAKGKWEKCIVQGKRIDINIHINYNIESNTFRMDDDHSYL